MRDHLLPLTCLLALAGCATPGGVPSSPSGGPEAPLEAGTIAGVVVRKGDDGALAAVDGCTVQLRRLGPREALRLQLAFNPVMGPLSFEDPEPPLPPEEERRLTAGTDDDGRFRFDGLARGPWLLEAACGGGLAGKVVRLGDGPAERVQLRLRERQYTVEGRVLSPEGRPIPGARVRLASGGTGILEETTDEQGEFSLESASRLLVAAVAIAPGFAEGSGAGSPFEPGRLEVRLQPATLLSGLVTDDRGPRAGAIVLVDGGRRRRVTGPDGGFSFDDLAPGPVELVAFHGDHTSGTIGLTLTASTPPIRLDLVPPAAIEVTARDEKGAPISGVTLTVASEGPAAVRGVTDEDGRVVLPSVPAGDVRLLLRRQGFAKREHRLSLGGGTRSFVELALAPAFDVTVIVRRADGGPLPPELFVSVEGPGEDRRVGARVRDGRTLLKELPPGAWRAIVKSCSFTEIEARFEVPGPAPEVVLPGCGIVQGRVLDADGDPTKLAEVSAERELPGRSSSVRREVERDGSFRLELPPGTWRLRAHRDSTDAEGTAPLDVATDAVGIELRLP